MKKIKIKIDNHNLNNENFKELLRSGQIEFSENADIILSCNEEKRIKIKNTDGIRFIQLKQIVLIESFDHEIYIVLDNKEEVMIRTPLKFVLEDLDESFMQINKSTIINLKKITYINASLWQRYFVTLTNNKKYTVTRTYYYKFKEKMDI